MDEFAVIHTYFTALGRYPSGQHAHTIRQGIGDDCAVLDLPAGHSLVVSIDTLVEGTHFVAGTDPEHLAWRLLGASISDLAAMGAEPAWLTLALTLPRADTDWLAAFSAALAQGLQYYDIQLIGGDTTRGPLTLSAQVHGFVAQGKALYRHGAQVGDGIFVSGTLGDSRGGLEYVLNPQCGTCDYLLQRFYRPTARLTLGQKIRDYATAAIDISDGLLADLQHILTASQVGATLDLHCIPLSKPLCAAFGIEQAQEWALSGGEDFELCVTMSSMQWIALCQQHPDIQSQFTRIGTIDTALGLRLKTESGLINTVAQGFNHFSD